MLPFSPLPLISTMVGSESSDHLEVGDDKLDIGSHYVAQPGLEL
jgi:hypothetical protein